MSAYIVYRLDGALVRSGSCPLAAVPLQAQDGEFVTVGELEHFDCFVEHWDLPADQGPIAHIVDKEPSPITAANLTPTANGVDVVTFANIPVGTTVTCPDLDIYNLAVTDSTLTVTFDLPGAYEFLFRSVKYLDFEATVNAH